MPYELTEIIKQIPQIAFLTTCGILFAGTLMKVVDFILYNTVVNIMLYLTGGTLVRKNQDKDREDK